MSLLKKANNELEYKGFTASLYFEEQTMKLHGKLLGIEDTITFMANSLEDVVPQFHNAVDDFMDDCVAMGRPIPRQYSGNLMLRIDPSLHASLARISETKDVSMNTLCSDVLGAFVRKSMQEAVRDSVARSST